MQTSLIGIHYHAILPEIIAAVTGVLIMMIEAISRKIDRRVAGGVALAGILAAAVAVISLWGKESTAFRGMIVSDPLRLCFAIVFLVAAMLTILISLRWVEDEGLPVGEYFALLMFATTGMLLMSAAGDLVMIFLGLEITSIATYVLCGYRRLDLRSNESAVKYFILGSFSTAFLLYGIALVYGATYNPALTPVATTNLALLHDRIMTGPLFSQPMLFAGAAMMFVGFAFKTATAPFHVWSPDVYEGAPTPITGLLSTGSKAAAFAAFARVFILTFSGTSIGLAAFGPSGGPLSSLQSNWVHVAMVAAVITMSLGNLVALTQTNVKRMLAYSSIAHAGYALLGIIAGDWKVVAFYLLSYVIINIGAFAVIEVIALPGDKRTLISDYSGIGFRSPGLTGALSLFLLSLAGLPLTGGFMAKLLVFKSAWAGGFHALVVIAVINSAISWYYYLRIVVVMFFSEPATDFVIPRIARGLAVALLLMVVGTLYLGILPGGLLNALQDSAGLPLK